MTDQSWLFDEVRLRVADTIRLRHDRLTADLDALVGTGLPEPPVGDLRTRLVNRTIELFAIALSGDVTENPVVAEFDRMHRAGLAPSHLFAAVRLAEGSVLHELSIDTDLGATSDHWPAVAAVTRRAAFELLQTLYERVAAAPHDVTDPVTRLMSRAVFEVAVTKELQRAVRYHHPVSLVLLEVDNLALIKERNGDGVGDLLMERLGAVMQRYFREPDWAARYSPDSIGVLLPETSAKDACALAEGAREAIERRLVFPDKEERPVRITASGAVVTMGWRSTSAQDRQALDARRMLSEAEAGVSRARARGGNTVEYLEVTRDSLSVGEAAACLHCSPATVRKLVGAGTLPAVTNGGRLRVDRATVEACGQRQIKAQRGRTRKSEIRSREPKGRRR